MQQPGGNRRRVELHLRQHLRHFQRMQHIRLARGAKLPVMVLQAVVPGLANDFGIVGGAVLADSLNQLAKLRGKHVPARFRDLKWSCLRSRHI